MKSLIKYSTLSSMARGRQAHDKHCLLAFRDKKGQRVRNKPTGNHVELGNEITATFYLWYIYLYSYFLVPKQTDYDQKKGNKSLNLIELYKQTILDIRMLLIIVQFILIVSSSSRW